MRGVDEGDVIEAGLDEDEKSEQEECEAGRREVKKLHDPKLPSEK